MNPRLPLEAVRRVADAVYAPQNLTETSVAVVRVRLAEELLRSGVTRQELDQATALLKTEAASARSPQEATSSVPDALASPVVTGPAAGDSANAGGRP